MKAIVYTKYGPPDVLQLKEVEKPMPKYNEVLIRIHAATVGLSDLMTRKGAPFFARFFTGLIMPKNPIPGAEFAGEIEAVGKDVKLFRKGDQVFGADLSGLGAYAEYKCLPEDGVLAIKPANVTWEEAAPVCGALAAWNFLTDQATIQSGQKVLINGASGSIGTTAVQIAKSFGAEVTAVCSTRNLDLVRSLGADYVIDYTKEDFTKNGKRYDLILATVGYRSIFDYRRALSPRGIYVVTGGSLAQVFQPMLLRSFVSMTGSKKMTNMTVRPNQEDLVFIKELIEVGKVKPVIDKRYPLGRVAEALRYYGEGHAQGKVIITVESSDKT
jgi:NADPH:quinone reductase-like Zn-dependent oxidoreductase